tara:strand:+ start:289 stop:438 length:150 start_codon:yes stop_codon:yes gene_type:complete
MENMKVIKELLEWIDKCPTQCEWSSSSSTLMHLKVAMYQEEKEENKDGQ